MSLLYIFLSSYFLLIILFFIILIVIFIFLKNDAAIRQDFLPRVSVLLAVRNEAHNIISCLQSFEALDYPKEKIEILIGDDASEDSTEQLILGFIAGKPNYQLLSIRSKLGMAGAKGNVLAHLAHQAKGDFFFITDADVRVPAVWVHGLLASWSENTATVSGSAVIAGNSLLSKFQCVDWITAFGMIHAAQHTGIPVTAVGNNMMVQREAYFEAGGYENIPFSVTEDFDLHEVVRKLGWRNKNLLNPDILTVTQPIKGFSNMMQQRKRWMHGAVRLPFILIFLLSLQSAFFPLLVTGLLCFPKISLAFWFIKFLLQNLFLLLVLKRVGHPVSLLKYALLYEIYSGLCAFILIIYYFLPLKTNWKGREYY
jgi:cellulose synthase/poly-beta-1,6-N-acetylglucosamine synthase-like glycosyltransferase